MNYLIVVDMQNDFIDGSLGTKEAQSIVKNVENIIKEFDGEVIFTRDTHYDNYLSTREGSYLPVVHCVKETKGWQICDELLTYTKEKKIFDKPCFGSIELSQYLVNKKDVESVTLVGLCTDICVISNAMIIKAALPEIDISVISKGCAGVTLESHENALNAMKMCQINIV